MTSCEIPQPFALFLSKLYTENLSVGVRGNIKKRPRQEGLIKMTNRMEKEGRWRGEEVTSNKRVCCRTKDTEDRFTGDDRKERNEMENVHSCVCCWSVLELEWDRGALNWLPGYAKFIVPLVYRKKKTMTRKNEGHKISCQTVLNYRLWQGLSVWTSQQQQRKELLFQDF